MPDDRARSRPLFVWDGRKTMPVYESYSRRKRRAEQTEPDVFQYDRVPDAVRAQIRFILEDAVGPYFVPAPYSMHEPDHNNIGWRAIRDAVCREKGRLSLANQDNAKEDCIHYLHAEQDVTQLFDLVEFAFQYIDQVVRKMDQHVRRGRGIRQSPDGAIKELNFRFREAGLGYQFEGGQIVRVDSQLVHAEVVKPALQLLGDARFKGAQDEFLSAHAHYRAGEYKDASTDALNAFESTMKVICDEKGWGYTSGARASDLIKVIRANGLLPEYLDKSFDQLIATLKTGLPTVRNEEGGHGQGGEIKETPGYVAAYALHLAAAKIVLLVEAFKDSE